MRKIAFWGRAIVVGVSFEHGCSDCHLVWQMCCGRMMCEVDQVTKLAQTAIQSQHLTDGL